MSGLRIQRPIRRRMNTRQFEIRAQKQWQRSTAPRPVPAPLIPWSSFRAWWRSLLWRPTPSRAWRRWHVEHPRHQEFI